MMDDIVSYIQSRMIRHLGLVTWNETRVASPEGARIP